MCGGVWVSGDSVVSPLAGDLNRLHMEPVQEKVEIEGATSGSEQCKTEEHSILDELRQIEQHWHSSQTHKHQRVNITRSFFFNFTSYKFLTNKYHLCDKMLEAE